MLAVVTVIAEILKQSEPLTIPEEITQLAKSSVSGDKDIAFLIQ